MFRALAIVTTAVLAGCASPQERMQRQSENSNLAARLSSAQHSTTVDCRNKATCDKAFSLAKVYVQMNADMKVQFSDDTTVSTYNPLDYGYVALQATKIPGAGDSASITLTASCKGMYGGSDLFFNMCARKIVPAYEGFKSYVESKITP